MVDADIYKRLSVLERAIDELKRAERATYDSIYFAATPTDHFNAPTLSPDWSWAAGLSGTPATVSLSIFPSHLAVGDGTSSSARFFLSRGFDGTASQYTRILPQLNMGVGLRIDDGSDNNYAEIITRDGTSGGTQRISFIIRTGGGAHNTTDLVDNLPQHPITLRIVQGGGNVLGYYTFEPHGVMSGWTGARFCGIQAFAPATSRCGLVFRSLSASGAGTDRTCAVDWYHVV